MKTLRKPIKLYGLLMILFFISGCHSGEKGNFYPPGSDNFNYVGRIDWSNPDAPRIYAPGVTISFAFSGKACTIYVDDEQRNGNDHNYLEIVVDDTLHYRVQTTEAQDTINVVRGLAAGTHRVVICKATESLIGYIDFRGVRCKKLLPGTADDSRLIEFIGNSITSGYGNDDRTIPCNTGEWYDQNNAWYSYGPITARALHARWVLSSNSGIGIIHSCCNKGYVMPDVYETVTLEPGGAPWKFDQDIPDLVTICLGQNDGIQDSAQMVDGYMDFLAMVRDHYPVIPIVCLSSPMANENLQHYQKMILSTVTDLSHQHGDSLVYDFYFSRGWNSGCDGHPNIEEDREIAAELVDYIKQTFGW